MHLALCRKFRMFAILALLYYHTVPVPSASAGGGCFMKRRFLAVRIVSIIFKILGVLNFIGMIGVIGYTLINATAFPTMETKLPVIGAAVAGLLVGTIILFAIGQYIDLMVALETNTRAQTAMLQRMGKVMKE